MTPANEPHLCVKKGDRDDGIAILLEEKPGPELLDDVKEAIAVCPAAAIRLVDQ
ncbi:ferredoxin [Streptomyces fulvoviolaceus]|uniref:ferredoxin n=1 Tax=Streptomyces fulvoviolaceus TaxID=285535 RepID=UPI003B83217C